MAAVVYQYDKTVKATYLTFQAWLTAIGIDERSIIIATDTEIVGTVVTPSNIDIAGFYNGAKFTGTGTLTINKMSCDPMHQIFANTLTVRLHAQNWDRPEWFGGGVNDNLTDETVAIQQAIDSLTDQGVIYFMAKTYRAVGIIQTGRQRTWQGVGPSSSRVILHTDTADLITINNSVETIGFHYKDILFGFDYSYLGSPAPATHDCFKLTRVALSSFINCHIGGFRRGIEFVLNCSTTDIVNCVFGSYNANALRFTSAGTQSDIKVIGCWFDENTSSGIYCNSSEILIADCQFKDNGGAHITFDASAQRNIVKNCHLLVGSGVFTTGTAIDMYGSNNDIDIYLDQHSFNGVLLRSGAGYNNISTRQVGVFTPVNDSSGETTNYFKKVYGGRSVEGRSVSDDGTTVKQIRGGIYVSSGASVADVRAFGGNVSAYGYIEAYKNSVIGDNFNSNSVSNVSAWVRKNITYSEMSDAGTTKTILLFTLPLGAVIEKVYIKPITQFAGTGLTQVYATVGVSGAETRHMRRYNIMAAPEYREFKIAECLACHNSISTDTISIFLTAVGANLNALTDGEIIVGLKIGMMRGV